MVEQKRSRGSCSVRVAETGSELIVNCGVTKITGVKIYCISISLKGGRKKYYFLPATTSLASS